jgi:hypothetical protein
MVGDGANDKRFDLNYDDLMPTCNSSVKNSQSDYWWHLQAEKHTLKEFEKDIYY